MNVREFLKLGAAAVSTCAVIGIKAFSPPAYPKVGIISCLRGCDHGGSGHCPQGTYIGQWDAIDIITNKSVIVLYPDVIFQDADDIKGVLKGIKFKNDNSSKGEPFTLYCNFKAKYKGSNPKYQHFIG